MKARPLASNRSARWALMERFEVPDYDRPERNYLTRWRLIQTPWFAFYLHRMDGPDSRPTLHDHPWPFVSFILRGGYWEDRLDPHELATHKRRVRFVNVMPIFGAHSIRHLLRTPTWTFLVVGRRRRMWGYLEPGCGDEWIWTPFDRHPHAREFDNAMAARKAAAWWPSTPPSPSSPSTACCASPSPPSTGWRSGACWTTCGLPWEEEG